MFRKAVVFFVVFLALTANYTVFSQSVTIDAAISNAVKEIAASVPRGTKIAVLNISSDYRGLSDYIIDELIVNLVNTRSFQVVPRSTIELELAQREFDFQSSGYVSDDDQKRIGYFLGTGTIISGSITRESSNSYRLVVTAIDLESFTYQSTSRISILNNNKMRELVTATGGGVFYADYTVGQRIGMGALNIFGGAGSFVNGYKSGWVTLGLEAFGLLAILGGLGVPIPPEPVIGNYYKWSSGGGTHSTSSLSPGQYAEAKAYYDGQIRDRDTWITIGSVAIGAGVVFGFVVPFFYHKPDNRVSQNNFPFGFEFVPSNNREIGLRVSYRVSF